VEIARRFGSEESPGFVNGVLDHIARQLAEYRRERDGG
jgi:transcription termination factor NusB